MRQREALQTLPRHSSGNSHPVNFDSVNFPWKYNDSCIQHLSESSTQFASIKESLYFLWKMNDSQCIASLDTTGHGGGAHDLITSFIEVRQEDQESSIQNVNISYGKSMIPGDDSNHVGHHRGGGGAHVPDRELIDANQHQHEPSYRKCQYFHWKMKGSCRNACISYRKSIIVTYSYPWGRSAGLAHI